MNARVSVQNRRHQEKPTEPITIHPRYGIIWERAMRVRREVSQLLEGPWTRRRFKNMLEDCVCCAAFEVYKHLYAQANGEYADAARHWEVAQGIVEYELPMLLYHPTKGLKRASSREKAAGEVLPIVQTQLAQYRKIVEDRYARRDHDVLDNRVRARRSLHPKRPPARLVEHQIQELFRWIEEVIDIAIEEYELQSV